MACIGFDTDASLFLFKKLQKNVDKTPKRCYSFTQKSDDEESRAVKSSERRRSV